MPRIVEIKIKGTAVGSQNLYACGKNFLLKKVLELFKANLTNIATSKRFYRVLGARNLKKKIISI